jgi:hypothetical protein
VLRESPLDMTDPMRILIDTRMLLGRFSGVARMVTGLVEELVRTPGVRVVALAGARPFHPWRNRPEIEQVLTGFDLGMRSPIRRVVWEATTLLGIIARCRADVYHATWNHGIPFGCPVPAV